MTRSTALSLAREMTLTLLEHQTLPYASSGPESGTKAAEWLTNYHAKLVQYFEGLQD